MQKFALLMSTLGLTFFLSACDNQTSPKTVEQKVQQQIESVHPLSDTERSLGNANAKAFFERSWPNDAGKSVTGQLIACRPSDSNANGLVTCTGYKGNLKDGSLMEIKMYCGYLPSLVGCSDQDTVTPQK
jgi:hypothetical protein